MIDWVLVRVGCPFCGSRLEHHSLTVWCCGCGWGINWEDWPVAKSEALRRAGRKSSEYGS